MGLPPGCPPLPTTHVKLRMPIPMSSAVKIDHFYYQFFHHHPELWVKYNADFAGNIKDILRAYLTWSKMVKDRQKRAAGENKAKVVESTRERLERKIQEQVREAELAVRREWTAIQRPSVDDEKRLLPPTRAAHLVRSTCRAGGDAVEGRGDGAGALDAELSWRTPWGSRWPWRDAGRGSGARS